MTYTVTSPQPTDLQAGEIAVVLTDTGQAVAVSVTASPVDNNAGTAFSAQARAINADGSTLMHDTVPMITAGTHMSSHAEVTTYGASALANAMILAVLGEALATVTVDSGGTNVTQTLPPIDPIVLANWSIRSMLVASVGAATVSAGALLKPAS